MPIATTALAPTMAAANRNVCFSTSDQPPIDPNSVGVQCNSDLSRYIPWQWILNNIKGIHSIAEGHSILQAHTIPALIDAA
jgi:hypothetical protein